MYTRDTAFSTWPTNCTGQQRSSTFGFWFGMGTRDVNAQVAATAAVAPKDIIFGKKTSFLEIIDYYTICPTEYPSSLVHPVKSSIIGGCWAAAATCDRILLQKEAGLHILMHLIDDWPACEASIEGEEEHRQKESTFRSSDAVACFLLLPFRPSR